eukprot:GFKZ01012866.1.p1 GENE.GFKZ01012866.1~~GFKZ01012866.1.p1  ORF type:complete len:455 (-),score=74.09 GFKZ01012866.1:849-2213(-)
MRLGGSRRPALKPLSARSISSSISSSMPSLPSLSRSRRSSSSSASKSACDMETLVTLFHRDPSRQESSSEGLDNDISMSQAGQRIIPATFKLVPIGGKNAVTDSNAADDDAFDQAGGHDGSFHSSGSMLVKKVTEREADFYEQANKGAWPVGLLPGFYGRTNGDSIQIEDLTYGFRRPCVMDLKMGIQTVEDDEKKLIKKLKMTALDVVTRTKQAGVRLEGLSMYRTLEKRRVKGNKMQSHSISAYVGITLQDIITFFLTDEHGVRTDVALRFQTAVEAILRQFEKNDKFRFIGSSILLIYDNDNRAPHMHWARALRKLHTIAPHVRLTEDQISGLTRRTRCDVRMIDFAHTGPMPADMKRDEGYITGLRTILDALGAIRKYRAKPIFSLRNAVVDVMEEQRAISLSGADRSDPSGSRDGQFTFDTLLRELTPMALGDDSADAEQKPTHSSSSP